MGALAEGVYLSVGARRARPQDVAVASCTSGEARHRDMVRAGRVGGASVWFGGAVPRIDVNQPWSRPGRGCADDGYGPHHVKQAAA
jgi:hypothetical protein